MFESEFLLSKMSIREHEFRALLNSEIMGKSVDGGGSAVTPDFCL
jgi:hypothetical protein